MENAMNTTPEMSCSPEIAAIRQRITACLMRAEAIELQDLVARTGYAAHDCAATLDDLTANGKVRELRPVAAQPGRHEAYYRLVRPSDRDWLWEQTLDRSGQISGDGPTFRARIEDDNHGGHRALIDAVMRRVDKFHDSVTGL